MGEVWIFSGTTHCDSVHCDNELFKTKQKTTPAHLRIISIWLLGLGGSRESINISMERDCFSPFRIK